MGERLPTNLLVWITGAGSKEQDGTPTRQIRDSVRRTWKGMWKSAVRRLRDEDRAEEALLEAVQCVARAGQHSAIERTDAYMTASAARKVSRFVGKIEPLDYIGSSHDLAAHERAPEKDWVRELDDQVFMQEFLAAMDDESRAICHMWLRGDEWREIARDAGCSVQQAKDKLRHAIERTKKRLLGLGSPTV